MKKILFAFLFVLSGVNAALAAEFLDIKANQCAITNNRIVCQYIPQRLQDYVIIGGTIVQPEGFEPFLPRVKIRFVPDDKNAKTLTTNAYTGSATFSLALKPEESGMLYFDIISQEALETYANPMPIPIKKNFDPESLKSLQVRVQYKNNSTRTGGGSTASTTRTGGGSSGTTTTGSTTGTTATGDLHTFSAYLIYDANNKHGSGISGATVIDVNTGNSTKTGRGGAFTLECLFTKQVNQNVGRQNIENLRSDLEASARNNGLKDPEAYATRIINENIQALFNTSTKPTAQCFLVFTAPNQASTYSNTITLEKAQNEYFVYKSYQRTSSPTRTSSGGNGSSSNDANTITVSGVVYSEGTKEHPEPILQEGVVLIPKGVKATNNNSAITGKNGTFTIEKFPRNHDLVAQFYTEQDALISYTDIEKNSSNIKIYVHEDNSGTVVVDNVEPAIADCMSDNMKKRLHATRGKWLGSTQNKDGKCIPTECQSDYTLEDAETLNARCLECNTNRVPFARSVKVENNRCVAKSCLDGFKEHSGNCVVDCSSSTAKNYLHATAAALKSNASTPSANETAQSLDYSKYCYPTACDTPKYAMSGSGENATCVSTSGTNCTDFIQHATAATINNGVCELQSCEDGYAVDKYALGISQKCDAAGHANDKCNGKCEYQIGKPCKGDIKTLTNDPHAKAGVITKFENGKITACKSTDCDSENYKVNEQTGKCERIAGDPCSPEEVAQIPHAKRGIRVVSKNGNVICRPVCWENYSERLSGNAYECYLKDLDCPKRIYNLPQYKDIASKMVVTNDDSYWDSEGNVRMCRIKECKDKKNQTPNPENDFQTCIDKCTEAEENRLKNEQHALETAKDKKTGECIISECECGYDVSRDKKSCIAWSPAPSCTKRTEPSLPANAKTAHMACDNSKQKYCSIDDCINELFTKQDGENGRKNAMCVSIGNDCTVTDGGPYASKDGFWELKDGKKICVPKSCTAVGYEVSKKTRKCEEVSKRCPDDILLKMDPKADDGVIIERDPADGSVKACQITKCKDGLDVEDGKMCVSSKCGCGQVYSGQGQCKDKDDTARQCNKGLPAHATGMGKLMCQNNNKVFNLTCAKGEKCKEVCVVQQCEDPYTPDTVNNICTAPNGNCDFEGDKEHAEAKGTWEQKSGKMVCKPICKGSNYEPYWDNQTKTYTGCVTKRDRTGKNCPKELLKTYPHASRGEITSEDINGVATACKITACDKGYNLNTTNNTCDYCGCGTVWDQSSMTCKTWSELGQDQCNPMPKGAKVATRACKDKSSGTKKENPVSECATENACVEFCEIIECDEPVYTLVNGACEAAAGKPCPADRLPPHAIAGKLNDKGECVVSDCERGYDVSDDKLSCKSQNLLTKSQHDQKVAELKENAEKMREKETSLENRIIGAAGIGMTGIGGSMVGAALSERAADARAEDVMAAYLQTFRCDYGAGKNVKGGEINVELPGGNDMFELYQEYAQLANDLKIRKEALGIRPGIESEIVIPKEETGLYDDVGTGITGPLKYASVARKILYPDGEDAAMWAEQKAATKKKLVTGAVVAGVGAVGSGVANYFVNRNNPNRSAEIIKKYEPLKKPLKDTETAVNAVAARTVIPCASIYGTTGYGNVPNCTCRDSKARFFQDKGCMTCPQNQVYNSNNECVCPDDKPVLKDDGSCVEKERDCELTDLRRDDICKCIDNAHAEDNVCVCNYGYHKNSDTSVKECVQDEEELEYDGNNAGAGGAIAAITGANADAQNNGDNGSSSGVADINAQNNGTSAGAADANAQKPADDANNNRNQIQNVITAVGGSGIGDVATNILTGGNQIAKISFKTDGLFNTSEYRLRPESTTAITKALSDVQKTAEENKIDLKTETDYCLMVVGKTDHVPFKTNTSNNQILSQQRAQAIATVLGSVFNTANIRTYGIADKDCPASKYDAAECRRVDVLFLPGNCSENMVTTAEWVKELAPNAASTLSKLISATKAQ